MVSPMTSGLGVRMSGERVSMELAFATETFVMSG